MISTDTQTTVTQTSSQMSATWPDYCVRRHPPASTRRGNRRNERPGRHRHHRGSKDAGPRCPPPRRRCRPCPDQTALPRLDPRVFRRHRGVGRCVAGRGVVGGGFRQGGPDDAGLHRGHDHHVHRQRHLSPGQLEIRDGPQLDEAGRPLDDLRVHRRQLHAVRAAGLAGPRRARGVVDCLGRCDRRNLAEDVLAGGAAARSGFRCTCCWVGWRSGTPRRSCTTPG